jgi:hypothetical protein
VKVLRLSNSIGRFGPIPPGRRSMEIAAAALANAAGEPVESISRVVWPTDKLPGLIDNRIAEHEPKVVLLWVNPYWFTYESVPHIVDTRFGRLGPVLGKVGKRIGARPVLSESPIFGRARGLLLRTVGGSVYFEPEALFPQIEGWVRRILRHEEIALVVRGALFPMAADADAAGKARATRRFLAMDALVRELCARLHVEYLPPPPPDLWPNHPDWLLPDRVHPNEAGHAVLGELETGAFLRAWRALTGGDPGPRPLGSRKRLRPSATYDEADVALPQGPGTPR